MHKDNFDADNLGARALTDEELQQIQGGNFLGDAWNAVKSYAGGVVDAVKRVFDFITHPPRLPFTDQPVPPPPYVPNPRRR